MNTEVSAYVPCFNNAATIRESVESILRQTVRPAEVLVVDDGSTDDSVKLLRGLDVQVIQHANNRGRGRTRSTAMQSARHDLVLSCDATNVLPIGFLAQAIKWFESSKVAAVYARVWQDDDSTVALRWRGRHLFKMDSPGFLNRNGSLITAGALVRRKAIEMVGGFNANLRHSEDADLGERLLAAGYEVISDPGLKVLSRVQNTVGEVLERYWRWHAGKNEAVTWGGYLKQITYSVNVMIPMDLRACDPLAVPISLLSPHYQFWRSHLRNRGSK